MGYGDMPAKPSVEVNKTAQAMDNLRPNKDQVQYFMAQSKIAARQKVANRSPAGRGKHGSHSAMVNGARTLPFSLRPIQLGGNTACPLWVTSGHESAGAKSAFDPKRTFETGKVRIPYCRT